MYAMCRMVLVSPPSRYFSYSNEKHERSYANFFTGPQDLVLNYRSQDLVRQRQMMPFPVSLVIQPAASVVFCMVYFYSRKGLDGLAATQIWSCTYDQFKRQSQRCCRKSFPWFHRTTGSVSSPKLGGTVFDRIEMVVL